MASNAGSVGGGSRWMLVRRRLLQAGLLICSLAAAGVALVANGGAQAAVRPTSKGGPSSSAGAPVAPVASVGSTSGGVRGARMRRYVVVSGDTLTSISGRFDVTLADLRGANRSIPRSGRIVVGEAIQVPPPRVVLPARLRRSPERLALRPSVQRWAKRNGIPADLVEATLWLESGWNQRRVSSTGAIGVGQLMPATAAFIERDLIGVDLDPAQTEDNIRMSARYLRFLLRMHGGDVTGALHAYYQGVGSIRVNGLYADTRAYAASVQALRARFRADLTGR